MAAGRAIALKPVTSENGGTAMKLLHISKKIPPHAQECQAKHKSLGLSQLLRPTQKNNG